MGNFHDFGYKSEARSNFTPQARLWKVVIIVNPWDPMGQAFVFDSAIINLGFNHPFALLHDSFRLLHNAAKS